MEPLEVLIAEMRLDFDQLSTTDAPIAHLIAELQNVDTSQGIGADYLYRIARLKSRRRAKLCKRNSPEVVRRQTRIAFEADNETRRMSALLVLDGVAVPTASCILAWSFPAKFGVIDRRAWEVLRNRGIVSGRPGGTNLGTKQWEDYHAVLQQLARGLERSPQAIDRWLYNKHKAENPPPRRRSRCCLA